MIWKYIKADSFFRDFLPSIRNHKRKISGRSGKGQPLEFSTEEKKQIRQALRKMLSDLKDW